jgi:hypothetical protein
MVVRCRRREKGPQCLLILFSALLLKACHKNKKTESAFRNNNEKIPPRHFPPQGIMNKCGSAALGTLREKTDLLAQAKNSGSKNKRALC